MQLALTNQSQWKSRARANRWSTCSAVRIDVHAATCTLINFGDTKSTSTVDFVLIWWYRLTRSESKSMDWLAHTEENHDQHSAWIYRVYHGKCTSEYE